MKTTLSLTRLMLVALVALTGTLAMTPVAHAGHGYGHARYKGADRDWRSSRDERGPTVIRESSAGPAIAGLVGGFLLGQAYGHGHTNHVIVRNSPPQRYRYYDPYDDEYYSSLDDCPTSYGPHHQTRYVRVIEISSGRCVDSMQWADGNWRSCDQGQYSRNYGRNDDDCEYSRGRDHGRGWGRGGRWNHGNNGNNDNDDEDDGR